MKNNKGITIVSLVIYMAVIFLIAAVVIRITTHFRTSMADVADITFETEFNKLNLYLLDEAKNVGNGIKEIIDQTEIIFTNGNKYRFADKSIYLNNTIKICENVDSCAFSQSIADNGKVVIILAIKIGETEKTVEYVISNPKKEQVINELDYTWNSLEGDTTT